MQLPNFTTKEFKLKTAALSLSFLLLICLTGYLALNKVQAQALNAQGFTVTPPTVSVTGDPGYSTEGTMGVINNSDAPLTFTAGMRDFIVQDTIGTPELLPPNTFANTYSAAAWMTVYPQTFTIQPGQRQNLNYYIRVPKNARPGGHYAAVAFTPVIKTGATNTGAVVNGQIGTLFSIAVNGPITENAFVSKFFTNFFQEYGPVQIATQIKNLGDLHITPQGTVTVTGVLFNQSQSLSNFRIFPQAARDYQNSFGQTFMIGRYKAVLLASYGKSNNLPLTATMYFWVFPWRLALVITLAIIAIILAALYFKKRQKTGHKEAEEPKTEAETPTAEVK